jgi:leucyl aminopeptidase
MNFRTVISAPTALASVSTSALLLVLVGDQVPSGLDKAVSQLIQDAVNHGDLELKAGKTLYVHRPAGLRTARLVVACAADASPKAVKAAVSAGVGALKALGGESITIALSAKTGWTEALAELVPQVLADASYIYSHTKPSATKAKTFGTVSLCVAKQDNAVAQGLRRGQAIAQGVGLARELANRPGNHMTPSMLAKETQRMGKQHGIKVEVLDRKQIEKVGMGSFLSVAQGSDEPPRFIVMHYHGGAKTAAPLVLVGKGITFDTGGISLKTGAEMDEMKFDMGGAASVIGTMAVIGELKPKINVVALVPTCENMPSGRAVKPGDVVTSLSGQTIEILNTDAEGRLILCDALTYAERFKPAAVVDVATLTGACVIALGHHHSGLYASDDALGQQLLDASARALDPAWRMPLDAEYDDLLKSNFADMANIGGRAGGSITAAKFLQRYTKKYAWAHLDIAGTAWKSGAAKGATGRPVPLLSHFVLARASQAKG